MMAAPLVEHLRGNRDLHAAAVGERDAAPSLRVERVREALAMDDGGRLGIVPVAERDRRAGVNEFAHLAIVADRAAPTEIVKLEIRAGLPEAEL